MLNLVTVCTDNFPMMYAEKLHNRFREVSALEAEHYCITDRPEQTNQWAKPIYPQKKASGWWNKLNLYSPTMPEGYILYMDIDIVIIDNFDDEISHTINSGHDMSCVSDAIEWMGCKFSSSFMIFKSGSQPKLFESFLKASKELETRAGGDQVWTGPQLSDVNFIDASFPNLKRNLKFHLAKKDGNNLSIPMQLPHGVKLVDCSGKPKPHELEKIPYIKENWHDVCTSLTTFAA